MQGYPDRILPEHNLRQCNLQDRLCSLLKMQVAMEGLKSMENWMKKIGVAMNISELGATEDMIDGITEGTLILEGGYKVLTKDEIRQVLINSL